MKDDGVLTPLRFEHLLRRVFGVKKKYHTAGFHQSPRWRAKHLRQLMRRVIVRVGAIDTTTQHREKLVTDARNVLESISTDEAPTWNLVYTLMSLVLSLLGQTGDHGLNTRTVSYWQSPGQRRITSSNTLEEFERDRSLVGLRREFVQTLRERGYSDFDISIVLQTSEYEVKRLRHS